VRKHLILVATLAALCCGTWIARADTIEDATDFDDSLKITIDGVTYVDIRFSDAGRGLAPELFLVEDIFYLPRDFIERTIVLLEPDAPVLTASDVLHITPVFSVFGDGIVGSFLSFDLPVSIGRASGLIPPDAIMFPERNGPIPVGLFFGLPNDAVVIESSLEVPGPIAGAGVPGLILASGGLLAWWRRRQRKESNN
jgi:hypothetical protein